MTFQEDITGIDADEFETILDSDVLELRTRIEMYCMRAAGEGKDITLSDIAMRFNLTGGEANQLLRGTSCAIERPERHTSSLNLKVRYVG